MACSHAHFCPPPIRPPLTQHGISDAPTEGATLVGSARRVWPARPRTINGIGRGRAVHPKLTAYRRSSAVSGPSVVGPATGKHSGGGLVRSGETTGRLQPFPAPERLRS